MAFDPMTAKLLAHAAKMAADRDSRRRTLTLILAPAVGLILLIALILYLLTNPFALLSQYLTGDEATTVQQFQVDYGYNQTLGIHEKDYTEGSGKSYEGVAFTDGETKVVYFNQLDKRWANKPYGTDTIGSCACGPTSMSIIVSSLAGKTIDPPTMAEWAYENGYWCSGNGSYHTLIPGVAKHFGLSCESISPDEPQKLVDALSSGKLVVALMSKGVRPDRV